MTVTELKAWMKKFGKSEVDIASILKLHPNTVVRILKGGRAHRSTIAAIDRMIADSRLTEQSSMPGSKATGT